jgi:restriction system protein
MYTEDGSAEVAANTAICVIHQANFLLDQQLRSLGKEFLEEGGFTEKLYRARTETRDRRKMT